MEHTIQEFKCPCCSGAIEFDTSLQKMKCPYCDTEFELDTLRQSLPTSHRRISISWQHFCRIMGLVSWLLRQLPRTKLWAAW